MKKREIKVLDESNLRWSMDQKGDALKFIDELQQADRDKSKDEMYFWQAHQYMQTHDITAIQKKFKSFRIPFSSVEKGIKIDDFSH